MNSIEGQIIVNLYPQDQPTSVEIHSTRSLHASKILVGKTPEQVLSIIPLLFNICGIAQSHAAYLAIEQKTDRTKDSERETAREILLFAENAREYLLRLFLDAPRLFQVNSQNTNLSYLAHVTKDFSIALFEKGKAFSLNARLNTKLDSVSELIETLENFLEKNVFQSALEEWQNYSKTNVQQWAGKTDTLAARIVNLLFETEWGMQGGAGCSVLPELDVRTLFELFNGDDAERFIARPEWHGQCFETTSLSRQLEHPLIQELSETYSSGLLTRWVARLIELATIPTQMRLLSKQLINDNLFVSQAGNAGIAQVEAARGRLIHRVDIEQDVISQYQILAPTEWNFHPQGMLSQALENLNIKDTAELEQLAHLMINIYDPCVGYQVRVH
jgi:coenzyme F420-reducing hydrogenase alpha subunit